MTGQARAAADTVLAFASDTGRACPAGALYAVANAAGRLQIARQRSGVYGSRLFVRLAALGVSNRLPSRA
jgi:hypothetical protein